MKAYRPPQIPIKANASSAKTPLQTTTKTNTDTNIMNDTNELKANWTSSSAIAEEDCEAESIEAKSTAHSSDTDEEPATEPKR